MDAVDSVEVYLLESTARRVRQFPWPVQVEVETRITQPAEREARRIIALVTASVVGRPEPAPDGGGQDSRSEPCLHIESTWQVVYVLSHDLYPSQEVANQFVHRNVLLNVWPYLREYVSTLTSKMNLPALYLPLMKFLR